MIITRAGFLTSVQDLGRTGYRQFGVSSGGALDSFALRVANLLVGNDENAAGLEITLGGLRLRFDEEQIVAWCGDEVDVHLGSMALPAGHAALLPAGKELKFSQPQTGCRCWFAVSLDSDRMGVRFDSPELKRQGNVDLTSEAVAPGTIQIPPSGKPILLLGDCQTIGGYPKIAHVITVDLGIAAQLRAGDQVRFSEVSLADGHRLLVEREQQLELFRIGLSLHTS